jgi:hypothetical protein
MSVFGQPYRIQGQVMMVGRLLMLRERSSRQLFDVLSLYRSHYLNQHITIQITDHGLHNPQGPDPDSPVLGGTH